MKNKEIKIWGTIALVVILACMVWMMIGNCNRSPKVVAPVDSTFYWKNAYNKEVASQKGLAVQFQLKNKKLADSLAKVYKTKEKYLQEWVLAFTSTKADVPAVPGTQEKDYDPPVVINGVKCPDQIKRMRQSFHSTYYDAEVQIGDSNYLHLQKRDTITMLWKKVKEGRFFNRRTYLQLDVSLADTSTKVIGIQSYRAGPLRPKRGGIGLQMGYEFDGKRFRPYFGLGFSYNIIRF